MTNTEEDKTSLPNIRKSKTLEKRVAVIDDIKTFRVSICQQIEGLVDASEHFENMDIFLAFFHNCIFHSKIKV